MSAAVRRSIYVVVACTVTAIVLAPVIWLVLVAVRDENEMFAGALPVVPESLSMAAFIELLGERSARRPIVNSVLAATAVAALATLLGLVVAAEFIRRDRKGFWLRQFGFALVAARFLPVAVTVPGLYWLLLRLDGLDTVNGLILSLLVPTFAFAVLLLAPSLASISRVEIEQAAVEGARGLLVFRQVVWPRIWPVVLIVFLLSFATSWNEFFLSSFITETSASQTLSVVVATAVGQYHIRYTILAAGGLVSILPAALIAFSLLFLQRWIRQ